MATQDALDFSSLGLKGKFLCIQDSPVHAHLKLQLHLSSVSKEGSSDGPSPSSLELLPIQFKTRNYFDLNLRQIIQRCIAQGTNVIHAHQPSLLPSLVPWVYSYPRVALFATRHILSNHSKKDFLHRLLYNRVDSLLVMSDALRRNVLQTHPIRERKIRVVNLGLDFKVFDSEGVHAEKQRAQWGAVENTIIIGMVGRIDPAKGQDIFLKAAAGLSKSLKPGMKLKFVVVGEETLGRSSQYLAQLKEMVLQFRLENDVVFAGYQDNIPLIMKAFDIFVMPSLEEAFGLVAIEAMAMERPVIVSKGGSSDEIIGNLEFGLAMRPEDAFDLQQKLRYLLDNPEERVKLGKRAREHVLAHYDRNQRIAKTLSLYERSLRLRRIL